MSQQSAIAEILSIAREQDDVNIESLKALGTAIVEIAKVLEGVETAEERKRILLSAAALHGITV